MRKLYSLLLLVSFTLFSNHRALSSHLLGGEITYECLTTGYNSGKFIFTLKLYRACYSGAAGLGTSESITNPLYANGGPATITVALIGPGLDLSPYCYNPSLEHRCGLPFAPNGRKALEEYIYVSSPIQINGIPLVTGSHFEFSACCRPTTINLYGQASFFLKATMFPYIDPVTNQPLSLGSQNDGPSCYDNSPKFSELVRPAYCSNQFNSMNYRSVDSDGDQIIYSWDEIYISSTDTVNWNSGYNKSSPLPNLFHDSNNIPAFLDTLTGFITFNTVAPVNMGYHALSVKVTTYRCGQKIAEVVREVPAVIVDCQSLNPIPAISNPNSPSIQIKENSSLSWQNSFSGVYYKGQNIHLNIQVEDPDTLPTSPALSAQSVNLEMRGDAMSDNMISSGSCNKPPCAFLDHLNPAYNNGKFKDTTSMTVDFIWNTGCENLFPLRMICDNDTSKTFEFEIKAYDNWCPVPDFSHSTIRITLIDTSTYGTMGIIREVDGSPTGGIQVTWGQYSGNPFLYYDLYNSFAVGGPWNHLVKLTNRASTTHFDNSAIALDTNPVYYILQINSNNNNCSAVDSNVVSSIYLKGDKDRRLVELDWTELSGNWAYSLDRAYNSTAWGNLYSGSLHAFWDYNLTAPLNTQVLYKVESQQLPALANIISNIVIFDLDSTDFVGIQEESNSDVNIFPNPVRKLLNVNRSSGFESGRFSVYSIEGAIVLSGNLSSISNDIDMSVLTEGIYFIEILENIERIEMKKLIVVK